MAEASLLKSSRQARVVFPLHGIRTRAKWIRAFTQLAEEFNWKSRQESWNFGRLSLLQFLSPWGRKAKEKWFLETYARERKDRDLRLNDERLPSVVAHSFGCYLVGYAILRYKGLKFNKIILCGSILPSDFPWDDLLESGRVRAVRNEYGVRDPWVKLVRYFVRGSGDSGARGLCPEREHPRLQQEEFVFNHADYFVQPHMEEWMDYLEEEEAIPPLKSVKIRWPKPRAPILLYLTIVILCAIALGVVARWTLPRRACFDDTGHCYQVVRFPQQITWKAAQADAVAHGGYLATILSAAENDFIFNLVNNPIYWQNGGENSLGPWIGGYQPRGSPEPDGGWTWVHGDGSFGAGSGAYTNWSSGSPNNYGEIESWLHFFAYGNDAISPQWNDLSEIKVQPIAYVIEYDR